MPDNCCFDVRSSPDLAFEWAGNAVRYNDPGLAEIVNDPLFENIKTDAHWLPLLESIGKSPERLLAIEFNVPLPE